MENCLRFGRSVLVGSAVLLWLVLAYLTTASGEPSTFGALVAVVPYMGIALAMALRARHRIPALLAWGTVALAIIWQWGHIESHFEWLYFIQHIGVFTLLTIGFGRTLGAGATPMITHFSRLVHGDPLPIELLRYTRAVTVAWTLFFAAMSASSAALFFFGPMSAWSLLVTLLTPALTAAMFAAEFIVRLLVLPGHMRTGLIDSIRVVACNGRRNAPPA
ncbi:COG4648 family protein [Pseudothauera lacus]|uniref:COG4648 family protein n=1 Tax=Pseudothauera lacus TaxID=2136175 RepID=UPI001F22B0D2|nr:hypothetical protein [Pseudothauera lacus]